MAKGVSLRTVNGKNTCSPCQAFQETSSTITRLCNAVTDSPASIAYRSGFGIRMSGLLDKIIDFSFEIALFVEVPRSYRLIVLFNAPVLEVRALRWVNV